MLVVKCIFGLYITYLVLAVMTCMVKLRTALFSYELHVLRLRTTAM